MGLRLTEAGVSNELFFNRFGKNIHAVFSTEVGELIAAGLLEWSGWGEDVLRLTPRGRLLGNQVFQRFV
jgi:oxygen-independent coproporphyrinogen-3 oxidase